MDFLLTKAYLISFLSTVLLSVLVTRFMIWANISDIPGSRSSHKNPTPRAGGVAVVLSFFAGAGLLFWLAPPTFTNTTTIISIVTSAILFGAIVSLLDDISSVAYRIRLFVQIAIATILFYIGLKIKCPPLQGFVGLDIVEFFLTILFLVFAMNAANFVDGLNGLLSGSVIMALPFMLATTLLLPGSVSTDYWVTLICVILFAALLGFYRYNFPKGRIFLGDVGSVFIGLMIGIIALLGQKGHPEQPTWMFINARLFLLIYPLGFIWFDPVFTVFRRYRLGRSMFEPNRDFMLHILNRAGYTHAQVSGLYYLSVIILGSLAILTPLGYMPFIGLVIGYIILQILFVIWVFWVAKHAKIET